MDDVIADADVLEELVLLRLGQLRLPPRVLEDNHERLPPLHDVLVPVVPVGEPLHLRGSQGNGPQPIDLHTGCTRVSRVGSRHHRGTRHV